MNKEMNGLFIGLVLLLFSSFGVQAQSQVRGLVRDQVTRRPLAGATITDSIGGITVSTNAKGEFAITASSPDASLNIRFLGYISQDVRIQDSEVVVDLVQDAAGLEEVVVVGYDSQRKVDLTGAVSVINTDNLKKSPNPNPIKAMQGQVPGVSIQTDGNPAGGATVRIRGVSTLNNNDPLYIIDGVPTKGSAFNILNSNDIESMQVLKDGSSAAIYGSRASNGVIIVTTKQAKTGQFAVTYSGAFTHSKNSIKPKMLGTLGRETVQWQAMINDGNNPDDLPYVKYNWHRDDNGKAILDEVDIPEFIVPGVRSANTDWFDALFQNGFTQEHSLSISGAGENTGSLFSVRYYDNDYVMHKKNNKRYSARLNTYQELFSKRIKIGQNVSISNVLDNGMADILPLSTALSLRSILPIYNEDGSFSGPVTGAFVDQQNPFMLLDINEWDRRQNLNVFGNVYLTAQLAEKLIFNTNVGLDYRNGLTRDIERTYHTGILRRDINSLSNLNSEDLNWNVNATLQYRYQVSDHHLDILLGTEFLKNRYRETQTYKEGFARETLDYMVENSGTGLQLARGNRSGYSLASFFGKMNYAYKNKYLVSLTTRYDGSSRFGSENRFGFFPSTSIGWKLDQEDFIRDNLSFFDELKIRAAWGVTGNQEISNTAIYTIYNPHYGESDIAFNSDNGTAYDIHGDDSGLLPSGYRKTQTGNNLMRWEQSSELNLGVDFRLYGFFGSFDVFDKKTKDILISPVYLAAIGEGGNRYFNGASMRTKGFEFTLGRHAMIGQVGYTVTANLGHYKDEITDLPSEVVSSYAGNVEQNILGRSVNSMFGYVADGIFKTQEEVTNHASQPGKDIGRLRYKDLNGDGDINDLDQTYIGVSAPLYEYGVNVALEYKKFDFSAFFQGVFDRDVNNGIKQRTDFSSLWAGINYGERMLNAWTPDNPNATIPAATLVNDNNEGRMSTYFVENGAYMKLRQVSIGYNFGAIKYVKNLRFYLTGENLFILKDNSGVNAFTAMDPENPSNTFPIPRNFSLGINVTF